MALNLFKTAITQLSQSDIAEKNGPQFFIFYKDALNQEHCLTSAKFVDYKKLLLDSFNKILNDIPLSEINTDKPTCKYFETYRLVEGYEKLKQISLNDSGVVDLQYFELFNKIQQVACKEIAKAWIKTLEPNKQTSYPYKLGNAARPPWWPEIIKHKEPDHIRKEERINLLTTICRKQLREFNILGESKDNNVVSKDDCTALKIMSCEKLVSEILDDEKKKILREIYYLSYQEHLYNTGKLKSPFINVTDLFSNATKRNYKANAISLVNSKSNSKVQKNVNQTSRWIKNATPSKTDFSQKVKIESESNFYSNSVVDSTSSEKREIKNRINSSQKRKNNQMGNVIECLLEETPSKLPKKQKISMSPISFDYSIKTPVFSDCSFTESIYSNSDISISTSFNIMNKTDIDISNLGLDLVLPCSTPCRSKPEISINSRFETKSKNTKLSNKKNSPFIAIPPKNKPDKPKIKLRAIKTNFDDMKTTMTAAMKSSIFMSSASALKAATVFGIPLTASWKKFSPKSFELFSNTLFDATKLFTPRIFDSMNANFELMDLDFNHAWPEYVSGQDK